jgi:hypothetical protein
MEFKNAILTTEIKENKTIYKSYITYDELMILIQNTNNDILKKKLLSYKNDILTLIDDDINSFNLFLKEKYYHRGFLNDLNIKDIHKILIKNVIFREIPSNNNESDELSSGPDEEPSVET